MFGCVTNMPQNTDMQEFFSNDNKPAAFSHTRILQCIEMSFFTPHSEVVHIHNIAEILEAVRSTLAAETETCGSPYAD